MSEPPGLAMQARWFSRLLAVLGLIGALAESHAQNPDAFNPGADYDVYAFAPQGEEILVGGGFRNLAGQPCGYLGRLTPDGALEPAFNSGTDYDVYTIATQDDGKILVGGDFSLLGGQPRSGLARLNADGSLDAAFNPEVGGGRVYSLAVQPDGKILVGGHFSTLAGQGRNNIGRLNPDGSVDTLFNPGATQNSYVSVSCLALQLDGKILVGGSFTSLGGQARTNIGRLNLNGSVDPDFAPHIAGLYYSRVSTIVVQSDGKRWEAISRS